MFLKKCLLVGVFASLALPTWAAKAPEPKEVPLSIRADAAPRADPSLQGFIQQVWSQSPALLGGQAALEAARARAEAAAKPLHNPALALDAERTDITTAILGLSQTLDWSDKQGALTRIAGQEVRAVAAGLSKIRQDIAVEALDALVRFSTAREMQALALRRSQLMEGFIDTVKRRHAAGDVGALDVTLAQVVYSEALMAQAASESELAEAEAAVQAVSGIAAPAQPSVRSRRESKHVAIAGWPQLPNQLAPPPERAEVTLLDSLPELAMLRGRMEAAKARVNLSERVGRIDPTIGIRAGREDSETLLGLSIEIPLFVRNNYRAEVRAASHDAVAQEQAYRDTHRRAMARLTGVLGRFKNTSRAWRAWVATGLQAHREQMRLLEQLWQAGELSATDFLIQAKQNIDTQTAATALKGEVWQAAIAWQAVSGQIEHWLGLANRDSETILGGSK